MKRILAIILAIIMCMAMTIAVGAETATDANHPPRLVDDADILSTDEEKELKSQLDEISERQQVDVAIVTVESLEGKTSEAFADDYFDYNGYGMGSKDDGIIFIISMGEREWAISTHEFAITAFTDAGQEYITDMVVPYLSEGSYYEAFDWFAYLCDDYVTQAKTGEPYDVGNMPDDVDLGVIGVIILAFPCFLIAAVIAFILKAIKKSSLKSVMMRNDASDYRGKLQILESYENYSHRDIRREKIESDNGGSSTHSSSSGRTHGGSSGSF